MSNTISLIVATAHNNVVGLNNHMPWHLPADLQYFKATTMGKPLILGRKTWDSIGGRPLPGRPHFVISRQQGLQLNGATVVANLDDALTAASAWLDKQASHEREIMVIGGGEIYRQALPVAHRVYRTLIDIDVEGDTFFPALDHSVWQVIQAKDVAAKDGAPAHTYQVLEKH